MKDPFDDRLDAYALLNCSETCTRADAQRNYTQQLVRRAAPQRDLQAAREILVHPEQRMLYDCFRYNFTEEIGDTEAWKAVEFDPAIDIPLPEFAPDSMPIDVAEIAAALKFEWTTPEPPDLGSLLDAIKPEAPTLPFDFDS
jgi:hypothetical protein